MHLPILARIVKVEAGSGLTHDDRLSDRSPLLETLTYDAARQVGVPVTFVDEDGVGGFPIGFAGEHTEPFGERDNGNSRVLGGVESASDRGRGRVMQGEKAYVSRTRERIMSVHAFIGT